MRSKVTIWLLALDAGKLKALIESKTLHKIVQCILEFVLGQVHITNNEKQKGCFEFLSENHLSIDIDVERQLDGIS